MIKKVLITLLLLFSISSALAMRPGDDDRGASVGAVLPAVPQIAWSDIQQGPLIGHGSFGDVYEGTWQGQDVALKILQMRTLPDLVKREFDEEVRVMWACQFPRVLRLHGVCTEPGHCAMILERMQGSLHNHLQKGEIPESQRLQIAIDMAQGLVNLHARGIVHRDLKSHNILCDARGRGKISDFGLSKIRTATSTITRGSLGTVRWCAPEVLSGQRPVTASDMYGYGMVLWELLTRKTPFEDLANEMIVMGMVLGGKREDIPPTCPPEWRDVIENCWRQDPTQRPTAEAVLAKFLALRPPERPVWLPEEEPHPSSIRVEGYARYPASRSDWEKVLRSYQDHPVPGYDVGRVEVIFNPAMNQRFEAQRPLLQQRHGNPRYGATWGQQPDAPLRTAILKHLETAADPYTEDDFPDVKLVPLWHGMAQRNLDSLLRTGYGDFCTTDDGYFGRGIYAALEAAYAELYANELAPTHQESGVLIFNWGMTHRSFPVLWQDYSPSQKKLVVTIEHPRYDSHFIPVVQGANPADYIPVTPPERHTYTEMAFCGVTAQNQLLPRYLVTLQAQIPSQLFVMGEALRAKEAHTAPKGKDALVLQLKGVMQEKDVLTREKDVLTQQKEELVQRNGDLTHQLTLMVTEQDRVKQEKDTLAREQDRYAKEIAALRERLRVFEARPVTAPSTPPARAALVAVPRPLGDGLVIPEIAKGYEDIYRRFVRGKLIYKPDPNSDKGRIDLPIIALVNPLEDEIDLSRCGDSGKDLSINTGYRKGKKAGNANKWEVWLAPRFLIERNLSGSAAHFKPIMGTWDPAAAPVGLLFTWGGWNDMGDYFYLTSNSFEQLSDNNLYEKYKKSLAYQRSTLAGGAAVPLSRAARFMFHL